MGTPTPDRLLKVGQALRLGVSHEEVHASCKIDPWFLEQAPGDHRSENRVKAHGMTPPHAGALRQLKAAGFSDARLAVLTGQERNRGARPCARRALGVRPVFKRIDTCAAEFKAPTPYHVLYLRGALRRHRLVDEAQPTDAKRKVIILGGGPNRIGQGIEFDYCCVTPASRCHRGRL